MPSFVFSIGGFAIYLLIVLMLLRVSSMSPAALVCISALALYPLTLAMPLVLKISIEFFRFSATYWFLTALFLLAFGAIYKSISLRILLDLLEQPERSENYEAILGRYIFKESFENRLEVMRKAGLAMATDGNYELTEKGRAMAAFISLLQRIFAIKQTG
jgi:hypothetical protein